MNIVTLNQYKDQGLLTNQSHPTLPLLIWNYSTKVQYEQLWDEITLQCRALVTDLGGNVIAKSFNKFFNIEENQHIPTDDFEVFEKLDGSLILAFWYDGEMVVASRGSFTSKYAIEAKRILEEKYAHEIRYMKNIASWGGIATFCFELIGFEQIVVSYSVCDLVLTGVFIGDNETHPRNFISEFGKNLTSAKSFEGLDWKNIKQLNWQNSEGFVVRFSNGSRCKIKFEDYLKLHWVMTDNTTGQIWKALMEGSPITDILNDVPDEFFEKIHLIEMEFRNKFIDIEKMSKLYFEYFKPLLNVGRQIFVEKVNLLVSQPYCSIVKAMIDNKKYDQMIWKYIKPAQSTKI